MQLFQWKLDNLNNAFVRRITQKLPSTVNVEIFAWGNLCVFRDIAFFAKISPTPYDFIKEMWEVSKNYPHVKGIDSIFAKFSPSENNHVYSMWSFPDAFFYHSMWQLTYSNYSTYKTSPKISTFVRIKSKYFSDLVGKESILKVLLMQATLFFCRSKQISKRNKTKVKRWATFLLWFNVTFSDISAI